jgi:hypothetical protein
VERHDMMQPGDPDRDDRRRRPIPWPLHVEISALLAAAAALLVVFYVLFGNPSEELRRIAVDLGYKDSYVRSCEAGLAYYLKSYENQQLVQQEYSKNVDPHDVRLAYDAQDSSGATVHGEFRCLFRKGSAYSSNYGPELNDVEVNGTELPAAQTVRIELFGFVETQKDR